MGCANTDIKKITANEFTIEEDEKRLWQNSKKEQEKLNQSEILYRDKDLKNYIDAVVSRLIRHEVYEKIAIEVHIIKNPYLNAFAFPNGSIYIHTGILAKINNEAELALLIAHEIIHITNRHALKSFRNFKNKSAVFAGINSTLGGLVLPSMLGEIGTKAAITGYSRDIEREADIEGIILTQKAGYNIEEGAKLFIHLKKEREEENIKEPFFFGTHPRIKERIENYDEFIKSNPEQSAEGEINKEIFLPKTLKLILFNVKLDQKLGRFDNAHNGIKKYLSMDPTNAEAYYILGENYRQQDSKNIEQAKENYLIASTLDPSYSEPHKRLGMIFYKSGEDELALIHLKSYLNLSPEADDKAYIELYVRELNKGESH